MNRRTGFGRHIRGEDASGDPLDGLVNLFDIGIVLAIAFLIAGLHITLDQAQHRLVKRPASSQRTGTLPSTQGALPASGRGKPVGTVYRLANGQLVYVKAKRR
ncbi:MAG TPA: DUF2149 domain-containing protein [Solirubrobacteraceae bacterium]|jgi:hypothetical protein